jgi:hypothetical protein
VRFVYDQKVDPGPDRGSGIRATTPVEGRFAGKDVGSAAWAEAFPQLFCQRDILGRAVLVARLWQRILQLCRYSERKRWARCTNSMSLFSAQGQRG